MQISLLEGHGIGPEVSTAARAVVAATGLQVEWVEWPMGAEAVERFGQAVPPGFVAAVQRQGACLKGPMLIESFKGQITLAGPDDAGPRTYPSINAALRRELGCFGQLRPIRGYRRVSGQYAGMDLVIVREITEDVYAGIESEPAPGRAEGIKLVTRAASERIARFAFEYARRAGRKRVTVLHKATVLNLTDGLFLQCARDVAAEFPDIQFDDILIDTAFYLLVRAPQRFDVVLCSNQYGDIFADLAAGLVGSLGLVAGANIGPRAGLFEAGHGAAPDIAGRNLANPLALILSAALMLEHLGHTAEAGAIRTAVEAYLEGDEPLTPDLGGTATTTLVTETLVRRVEAARLMAPR
ncbi:MAG: isocitrate/isopropylmalate dehydrogenase family protein [Chloroflexi bacterium]|nr:isocitrate/isopropylmalate dehydrogenase family protein [Chloroflexota bacterium]